MAGDLIGEMLRPLWLVWLVVVFGAVLVYAYRPGNRRRFEQQAQIPLRDDQ